MDWRYNPDCTSCSYADLMQPPLLGSGVSRRMLPAPAGWTLPFSARDLSPNHRSHHKRSKDQDDRTESSYSPNSRKRFEDAKNRPDKLTPESAYNQESHDGEDEISIYTTLDRGYTVAQQIHSSSPSSVYPTTAELFKGIGAHSSAGFSLDSLLRSSIQPYGGSKESGTKKWLPFDKLFELVNESFVNQELLQAFNNELSANELGAYVKEICGPIIYKDDRDNNLKSSSRSIFAILTLMGELRSVPHFVDPESRLSDKDLPLDSRKNPGTNTYEFFSVMLPGSVWPGPKDWKGKEYDSFMDYQSYMLSPFFKLRQKNIVPFYDLYRNTVLPFIEDGEKNRRREGHHGNVWRVKIHPAHHDFNMDNHGKNPYFAVKSLNSENDEGNGFKGEVNAWAKSVGTTGHRHLVQLLATWRQRGRWHLLFPWAVGNLRDYWITNKPPNTDPECVQWIAKQCLGVAEGLRKIHRTGSEDPNSDHHDWGIHGDIKPENILLFDDSEDTLGILAICDFGFTRFHSRETRSNAKPEGCTGTYRAPEYDMKRGISRLYDMWTLGCLYLEFITWYLTGYEGVDRFSVERKRADSEVIPADKFFECINLHEEGMRGVIIKPCVLDWIRYLRTLEHCSNLLHDFLDVIEKDLLVIDTHFRQTCGMTVQKLREIRDKCMAEGKSYCFTGNPTPMTVALVRVQNDPVPFRLPKVERSDFQPNAMPPPYSTWMADSGLSGEPEQNHAYDNIGNVLADQIARRDGAPMKINLQKQIEDDNENVDRSEGTEEEMDEEYNEEMVGLQGDSHEYEELDEDAPLLSSPGSFLQISPQSQDFDYLTASPGPLDRDVFISDLYLPAAPTQSAERTTHGSTETRIEQIGGGPETASTERSILLPRGDDVLGSSPAPVTSDGRSNRRHEPRSCWNGTVKLLRFISSWLGNWLGCVRSRTRYRNRSRNTER
ncbi:kinase-like protein [Mollisia scopiformis]|uniref:Kinase-like protein n=1 Tax=Mollisia scopiformis TaxID=149040 RepID=A0A132B693_MOLSC|nr:kinase-like protein [Mollisia scopiformis]KUJ07851.1 kinase-like protein [Mollisia scopiformis]